jgi:hypothetical protein
MAVITVELEHSQCISSDDHVYCGEHIRALNVYHYPILYISVGSV